MEQQKPRKRTPRTKSGNWLTSDQLEQAWQDHEQDRHDDEVHQNETRNRFERHGRGLNF